MPGEQQSDNFAIVVTDLKGWVRHRSGQVDKMLDSPPPGKTDATPFPDWFAAASRIDALEMLSCCLDRGWSAEHQLNYRRANGCEIPIWVECSLVTDSEGKPTNITWLLRDTESRRQLQAALAESQERYRHLFESSPSAITLLSLEGEILDCNPIALQIAGVPRSELIGQFFFKLPIIVEKDQQLLAELPGKLLQQNRPSHFELQIMRSGAAPIWIENFASLLASEDKPYAIQVITRDITERKRIEQALKDSEARHRELFESISEGIGLVDQSESICFCNPAFAEIFDVDTPDELIGRSLLDFVIPEERELVVAETDERIHGRRSRYVINIISARGNKKVLRVSVSPRLDAQGKYVGAFGVITDITELHRIETQLRDSEFRFRELADLLPQTVFEVDSDGRLTYVNRTALEQFGYTEEDFEAGLSAIQMFIPEDRERLIENINRRLQGEAASGRDYTAQRKDGTTFPARTYTSEILHEGKAIGLRGLVFDMTEIRRAEEQVRESEARFRTIAESMPLSLIITEPDDGRVLYANSRFKKEFGFSDEDLKTLKTPTQFADPADRERMVAYIRREGHIKDYEVEVHRADRTLMTISVAASPILYDGRQVLLAVIEDITERRRVELAEREARERLDATLNALPDLLFEVDQDGRIYNWHSSRLEELYLPPEEFLGKKMAEVLPPEPAQIIEEALAEAAQTGRHRGAIYALEIGGSERWYELSIAAKGERTREHARFILTIRDVTKREVANTALRESEQRYRTLQDNVPIGLFQSTAAGKVAFVNKAVVTMFGYESAAEILENNALDAYEDPRDRERLVEELTRSGSVKGFETRLKRRDGSTFWGALNITSGGSQDDSVTHFDGTLTDITDRKLAEAALASSEKRYRLLVENIRIVIARINYDGEFLFVNQYAAKRLGQRQKDVVGMKMADAFPSPHADRQLSSLREAIDTGQSLNRETQVQIGGKSFWFSTTIQPYPDTDGQIKSAMIIADDITERRRAEEELRLAHEGLKAEQQALVVKNIALKELLGQIDDEKQRIKQQIQANLDRVAIPMLEALTKKLPGDLRTTASVLQQCLKDIGSPYIGELESRFSSLTPREVEICNMIRNGLQSKEIARELEISVRTVEKFRQQIRRKLGIINHETNLVSFLRNI